MNDIGKLLTNNGYQELFLRGDQNLLLGKIWQDGNNQAILESIIENPNSSFHAKFLSAEVLRHFEVELDSEHYQTLAEAYSFALEYSSVNKEGFIYLNGNLWGFLYEMDDAGTLGKQLVEFGEAAIPHLIKLLDNDDDGILYEGSQEATIGNEYQYRIKDFAAFYISKITKIPITFYQDLDQRDAEIERFKKLLKEDGYGKK